MKRSAIVVATTALFAIAAPLAPAHAGEAGYLARLGVDFGYTITDDTTPAALQAGYVVCDALRAGTPRERLAASVYWAIPNATQDQADGLAYAAQRELCPETAE